MSEKQKSDQTVGNNVGIREMPITIHSQYVRDISFENPNAPESLRTNQALPNLEVNISMDARSLEDPAIKNFYEVGLSVSAVAERPDAPMFLAEILYGVTVSIGDSVPSEQHHPILLIEVPKLAFPFVRQILANVTQLGGYPPVLLAPVDFQALYLERFKDDIQNIPEKTNGKTA